MLDNRAEEILTLPADGANWSHILQAFDLLRRRVARRLLGQDGFFPGYDDIDLAAVPDLPGAEIVCSAQVREVSARAHDVSYTAVFVHASEQRGMTPEVISKGHGRTFALPEGGC